MNPKQAPAAYPDEDIGGSVESALFTRMARGDELALGELYDRWEPRIRALALGIVGDAMTADDVVEDVFWQAWRQAGRFDAARGSASSWLTTLARSRSLDRLRASRRTRDEHSIDLLEPGTADLALLSDSDPHRDAEGDDVARLVRAGMSTLPADQRNVIDLAYFEGLSQTEIAERTGQPLGTIKTRMRLALLKLRERFADLEAHL